MNMAHIVFGAATLWLVWNLEASTNAPQEHSSPGSARTEYAETAVPTQSVTRTSDFRAAEATLTSDIDLRSSIAEQPYPAQDSNIYSPGGAMSLYSIENRLSSPNLLGGESLSGQMGTVGYDVADASRVHVPFVNGAREGGIVQHLGPLGIDIYSLSTQGLYSNLRYPNAPQSNDQEFIAIVGLQGAITLDVGDAFHLGATFFLYYLPTVNKVGFYSISGNDFLESRASFVFQQDVGAWHLAIGDQFRTAYALGNLIGGFEVDEIATAGRYRFGRPETAKSRGGYFLGEDVRFVNTTTASASTRLSDDWMFKALVSHVNIWTDGQTNYGNEAWYGQAGFYYDPPEGWYSAWTTYNYYRFQDGQLDSQGVQVGISAALSPTFHVRARAGWLNRITGSVAGGRDRFVWEAGIVHDVNQWLSHSVYGGDTYVVTDFGDSFLGRYGRYTVTAQEPGSSWRFGAAVQADKDDLTGIDRILYGGRISWMFTDRSTLAFLGGWTRSDKLGKFEYKRRIIGLVLSHKLTTNLTLDAGWYMSEQRYNHSESDYDEQIFKLGLTETF